MEPHKAELTTTSEHRNDGRKPRFQIVKLEERVAPGCRFNPNAGPPAGYFYHGHFYRYKVGKYVGKC